MDHHPKLTKLAADFCGTQSKLAAAIKVPPSLVSQWATGHRPIAAKHCIAIELATNGKVTRYALRPDVFCAPNDTRATDSAEPTANHG